MYQKPATIKNPALIIFLLDIGSSMKKAFEHHTRIQVAKKCLETILIEMIQRSLRQNKVAPRYRTSIIGYADEVYDLSNGVHSLETIAQKGIPALKTMSKESDFLKGLKYVKYLLDNEFGNLSEMSPAPLIIHITDGEFIYEENIELILREIQNMEVTDGKILFENLFVNDKLSFPLENASTWQGYKASNDLGNFYANLLLSCSSPLPETYRQLMLASGYSIKPESVMMYPSEKTEIAKLALAMPIVS